MSVIVELSLPADGFELGRVLSVEGETSIVLETLVPLGERSVPFFRVHSGARESFEAAARDHGTVNELREVGSHDDEVLYSLDWDIAEDAFFEILMAMDARVLEATGTARRWRFELRFPSHGSLSDFRTRCEDTDIPVEVGRIYNPTRPDAGPWYGLTSRQRVRLRRAVERGYYSIPRQVSTAELAAEFDISDQAVTERLRRSIVTLTTNSLLLDDQDED